MGGRSELFTGSAADALRLSGELDTGRRLPDGGHVTLPALSAFDLECLGEVAARWVSYGSGDLGLTPVDGGDHVYRLPHLLCEVLTELDATREPATVHQVAREWAECDVELDAAAADEVLRAVLGLVAPAHRNHQDVYLWVARRPAPAR